MKTKGIYIYGIIPNIYSAEMFRSLEKCGVYAIPFQNISAIVSDRNSTTLDYSDRETLGHLLVHHQKTIEGLVALGFNMILPVQLGTIVSSINNILKILENGHDLIINTLNKIEHLTEIDLAVTWADFLDTIKEISDYPEIVAMKEDILKKADDISQIDQVKIGMLMEQKLKEKNAKVELDILDAISAFSTDIKIHEVMDDQMITNSAFLINQNKKEKFEKVIDRLDEEYKGKLNFKLVGPLPCYSFYTVEVKELNMEQVAEAKMELQLTENVSETEIKKAYQEKAKEFHPDVNQGNGSIDYFNRIKKAYQTLLEYLEAVNFASKEHVASLNMGKAIENMIVVKIKE
jgi:hypothetical protein